MPANLSVPKVPAIRRPTPLTADRAFVEEHDRFVPGYDAALPPYGAAHPTKTGYFLALISPKESSAGLDLWFYVNDRQPAEDCYNYSISYAGETNAYPIFTRDYLVRRASYTPGTKGTPLAGLYRSTVTAGGAGYIQAAATLAGGTGSGGVVTPVISPAGALVYLVILNEGNYTAPPAVTILGAGTGAAATVSVQPASAVLTKEDADRQQGAPTDSLYMLVRRVYETLPGPWIPFTRYHDDRGPIQGRKRVVATAPGQKATETATTKTTYEGREGSAIVSWQIEEASTDGTGSDTDHPLFPFNVTDDEDDARGAFQIVSQLAIQTGAEEGSFEIIANGVFGRTITNAGAGYTSPPVVSFSGGDGAGAAAVTHINAAGQVSALIITDPGQGYTSAPTLSFSGGGGTGAAATVTTAATLAKKIRYEPAGTGLVKKFIETWALPGPRRDAISYPYGDAGRRIVSTRQIARASYTGRTANGTAHPTVAAALLVDEQLEKGNSVVADLTQTFDEVPAAADQQGFGFFVEYPWGDTAFPKLTWRFTATRLGYAPAAFGSACPIPGFTSLVLSEIPEPAKAEAPTEIVVVRVFEILPGKPIPGNAPNDFDGAVVTETRTRSVLSSITPGETLTAINTIWNRTTREPISAYVGVEVVRSRTVTGPELSEPGYDPATSAATTNYRQQVIGTAAALVPGAVKSGKVIITSEVLKNRNSALVGTLVTETRTTPTPDQAGTDVFPDMQEEIVVTSRTVELPYTTDNTVVGVKQVVRPINAEEGELTITDYRALLSHTYEELDQITISLPNVLRGTFIYNNRGYNRLYRRFSKNVMARLETSFTDEETEPVDDLASIVEAQWDFPGWSGDCLTDEQTFAYYPDGGVTLFTGDLPSSIPAAADYLANWVGEEVLWRYESKLLTAGIYINRGWYVTIPEYP